MSPSSYFVTHGLAVAATMLAIGSLPALAQATDPLPKPDGVVLDRSLSVAQREAMELAARRYYAFWDTGDESYARLALAPDFVDRNLPAGRPQGPEGPIVASKNFRIAVPDLRAKVEEMIIVGDRVIGRLRFTGRYTGTFQGKPGDGRHIEFLAIDIYRIANGRISENWHIEDNLALLQQLGAVAK